MSRTYSVNEQADYIRFNPFKPLSRLWYMLKEFSSFVFNFLKIIIALLVVIIIILAIVYILIR